MRALRFLLYCAALIAIMLAGIPAFAEQNGNDNVGTWAKFSVKNPLIKKVYFVNFSGDYRGEPNKDVNNGSGFVLKVENCFYFSTAAHVVGDSTSDFDGDTHTFTFQDYAGNKFDTFPAIVFWDIDLAVFTLANDNDAKNIDPKTIVTTISAIDTDEPAFSCGFDIGDAQALFPACFDTHVMAKLPHVVVGSEKSFTIKYIIAIGNSIERGFSGGPAFNSKGELIGMNVAISSTGKFGYLENGMAIKKAIEKFHAYRRAQEKEMEKTEQQSSESP